MVKPIAHFIDQFERQVLAAQDARDHSVVVGAGVGAVEVVLASNLRVPNHQWTLVVGQQRSTAWRAETGTRECSAAMCRSRHSTGQEASGAGRA